MELSSPGIQFPTEISKFHLGPYHPILFGPIDFLISSDGGIVSDLQYELGFSHKGIEKGFEFQSWVSAIPLASRIDPEVSPVGELLYCMAVEEILGLETPERAKAIRILITELSRIFSHL